MERDTSCWIHFPRPTPIDHRKPNHNFRHFKRKLQVNKINNIHSCASRPRECHLEYTMTFHFQPESADTQIRPCVSQRSLHLHKIRRSAFARARLGHSNSLGPSKNERWFNLSRTFHTNTCSWCVLGVMGYAVLMGKVYLEKTLTEFLIEDHWSFVLL